jgi:NAD(P)-dependent dehydrogenase (short-subunit alcohol dehydrogenase family)
MALILIIGASRGIGLGLVQAYVAQGHRVIATVRNPEDKTRLQGEGAEVLVVDVADPASVSGLAWQLDGEAVDLALYVAGVWSDLPADVPPASPSSTASCTPMCWAPCRHCPRWHRWSRPQVACSVWSAAACRA